MSSEKIVLLTGATGKLGIQFLEWFLNNEYKVIFTSRSNDRVEQINNRYLTYYNKKKLVGLDINLEQETMLQDFLAFLDKYNCFPSLLVNNARNVEYLKKEGTLLGRRQWLGEFLVDVIVPYEISMGLAFHPKTKLRNIINISSIYGIVAPNLKLYTDFQNDSPINYGICKSGLIHLTKELAVRLVEKDIRVNCISYGGVEGRVDDTFKQRYAELCPQGKMLKDQDVIGPMSFLASEMSSGMTGHNLVVDGGWTIW